MRSRLARLLSICLVLWVPVLGMRAQAEGPDFAILERLALPWACGEGHRITWNPESHWTNGNSRGLAFDFSMVEGTPILAPADGTATFKLDDQPFVPNLGNHVDLAIEGGWRLRFAHLRDTQEGERQVRAGEVLGYSGTSGAAKPHLHMELIRPDGMPWSPDDTPKIAYYFGLPFGDWYEQAVIAKRDCPANIILAGPVHPLQPSIELGQPIDVIVPLRNIGSHPTTLRSVQIVASDGKGTSLTAESHGEWPAKVQEDQEIRVKVWPSVAGEWDVDRVTFIGNDGSASVPASASWMVNPSPLRLVGVRGPSALMVGERVTLEAWVENTGTHDLWVEDLHAEGNRPDHADWRASSGYSQRIPAGDVARLTLQSSTLPQHVGPWEMGRIAFQRGDHSFTLAEVEESFVVLGPQLVVEDIFASAAGGMLHVFMLLKNQGTEIAAPESIEVWGWQPQGEDAFSVRAGPSLAVNPGEATLIRLEVPLQGVAGPWRLVEAGYWNQGTFCRMSLPTRPTILVSPDALAGAAP